MLIGLLGGECTGKTALASALAHELGAVVVTEALRDFVEATGRVPRPEEQAGIMAEQESRLRIALAGAGPSGIVVADPLPAMTAAYSVAYFGDHGLDARARADLDRCDLIAWCQPDIPWAADGLMRDGEDMRAAAHDAVAALLAEAHRSRGTSPGSSTGAVVVRAAGPLSERVGSIRAALARLGS